MIKNENNNTNCFGLSLAKGEFLILSSFDANLIVNEEYQLAKEEGISDMSSVQVGDIGIINNGDHYIKAIGKNENGELIWESKNGFGDVYTGTLTELQKLHGTTDGASDLLDTKLLTPENLTIARKKESDRTMNTGGVPYVSQEGKKRIFKFLTGKEYGDSKESGNKKQ